MFNEFTVSYGTNTITASDRGLLHSGTHAESVSQHTGEQTTALKAAPNGSAPAQEAEQEDFWGMRGGCQEEVLSLENTS